MVGMDVGDVGLGLEGHLDDMLGPDAAGFERVPQQEHDSGPRTGTAGEAILLTAFLRYAA